MIRVQYFNGKEWETISEWGNQIIAWGSLGGDTYNHRIVDENNNVLKKDTTFKQ